MEFDSALIATIVASHGGSFITIKRGELYPVLLFAGMDPDARTAPVHNGQRYGREIERLRAVAPKELIAFADANKPTTDADAAEYTRVLHDTFGETIKLYPTW